MLKNPGVNLTRKPKKVLVGFGYLDESRSRPEPLTPRLLSRACLESPKVHPDRARIGFRSISWIIET